MQKIAQKMFIFEHNDDLIKFFDKLYLGVKGKKFKFYKFLALLI